MEKGAKISIGKNCFFNNDCSVNALESVIIGDGNIFGENVKIYDHNHVYKDHNVSLKKQGFITKPVVMGNNCWVGSNVTVLQGVHIGNNCVIGAGCLIYKDIEEGSIVTNDSKITVRNSSEENKTNGTY
ncbi:MAG: acyltransferase [Clostridiales bacterium]|nr:acyltransferase [Clostridiales bacterium]